MKIAIITGGSGPEREVSLRSAKNIRGNINFAKIENFLYPEEYENFILKNDEFDLIIPIIHGDDGEDGKIQKLLEEENIKYIFSDSETHAICFNKEIAKKFAEEAGFMTPKSFLYSKIKNIDFPIIAKPKENGSSIGIHLIKNKDELDRIGFLDNYIYEEYIKGREFTIGVIETEKGNVVLPIMEAKIEKEIFDFEDKYSDDAKNIEIFPDNLVDDLEKKLKEKTLKIHELIELKHMSRTDIIVKENGDIYFLEINSIPGCTAISLIPKMIDEANLEFSVLLKSWIDDVKK